MSVYNGCIAIPRFGQIGHPDTRWRAPSMTASGVIWIGELAWLIINAP